MIQPEEWQLLQIWLILQWRQHHQDLLKQRIDKVKMEWEKYESLPWYKQLFTKFPEI